MRKIAVSGKHGVQDAVQLLRPRRGRVRTASRPRRAPRRRSPTWRAARPRSRTCSAGWRGSAADALRVAERLAQRREGGGVVVVAVDVAQQAERACRRGVGSTPPPCFSRLSLRARLQLLEGPAGLGDADDRHVERAAPDHRLQRREDLLVREVAGGAEEDERVGLRRAPSALGLLLDVTAEPEAHRRQDLLGEVGLAARGEALVERRAQHRRRHAPRRSPP